MKSKTRGQALKKDVMEKESYPQPKDFDLNEFTKSVFFMYEGEKVEVDLRCDNSLMKTIVDRFGEDVTTLAYDMESFHVITEVAASPAFFGWVFGFAGKVEILGPKNIREKYKNMIIESYKDMVD